MSSGRKRNGKFIAVANMKGGVGKTTTVVSLAETFASLDPDCKVLVIDLDPQASASICIAGDELLADMIEKGRTIDAHLSLRLISKQPSDLRRKIRTNLSNATLASEPIYLALLPSGLYLRLLERELIYTLTKRRLSMDEINDRLAAMFECDVEPLRADYDFIIFDCPPGISPITEVALAAADLQIVPTIPDKISGYGLQSFCDVINGGGTKRAKRRPAVLLTRVQSTLVQHKQTIAEITAAAAQPDSYFDLMETRIPMSAKLASGLVNSTVPTLHAKYGADINLLLGDLAAEVRRTLQ